MKQYVLTGMIRCRLARFQTQKQRLAASGVDVGDTAAKNARERESDTGAHTVSFTRLNLNICLRDMQLAADRRMSVGELQELTRAKRICYLIGRIKQSMKCSSL